jgi:hypothetical protein
VLVVCALNARDLSGLRKPDVIVFPERVAIAEIDRAEKTFPNAILVGAVQEGKFCRAVLRHHRANQINYLKVCGDRFAAGYDKRPTRNPVYTFGDVCIGVLVCRDLQIGEFTRDVANALKTSRASHGFVCIPADMDNYWFGGPTIPTREFDGVHVALCNNTTNENRCRSFVADQHGTKIVWQSRLEMIQLGL